MTKKPKASKPRPRLRACLSPILPSESTVVLSGKRTVTVHGCRRILIYRPDEVGLRVGSAILTVTGERLLCTAFTAGTAVIEGEILCVRYCEEGGEEA